ncbi:hypothetical protein [Filimonas effusa]|uniref:Uncharacterized protein n=1 Tax=Filimonas effusa TaxID=2508721 RepID=A0A4Q1D6T3_9BACT|nr:hypothetical protein [Filimonas effusa]RXK83736.1 hypothetical protein ESB13_16805 [Filimonas effusa]
MSITPVRKPRLEDDGLYDPKVREDLWPDEPHFPNDDMEDLLEEPGISDGDAAEESVPAVVADPDLQEGDDFDEDDDTTEFVEWEEEDDEEDEI